ncbi:MAG: helix-turn-helix domain-containing protein [Acidimicrobiia bacterium]|nr:helix-turn-helix domain-containing protein [Acidimicrobiia bacterium]
MTASRQRDLDADLDGIGRRLRETRLASGMSQRELARRLGLSPSLISQIESGASNPSVGTLYAIVTELNVSLDTVIRGGPHDKSQSASTDKPEPFVVRAGERPVISLESGVTWEELSDRREVGLDFVYSVYEVGGTSSPDGSLMRHNGREYGFVVSGVLTAQIGFSEFEISAGDSVSFDSTRPHRYVNRGSVPVQALWLVIDRDERSGETSISLSPH